MTQKLTKKPWDSPRALYVGGARAGADLSSQLKAAGLGWEVRLEDLLVRDTPYDKMRAMVRSDTGQVLGVCGPRYTPVQNHEAFGIFETYARLGQMTLEHVGIAQSVWAWGLAKLPWSFTLPGNDKVQAYLLLSHPHIWGKAGVFMLTPVRVHCFNTIPWVLKHGNLGSTRFPHMGNFEQRWRPRIESDMTHALSAFKDHEDKVKVLSLTRAHDLPTLGLIRKLFMAGKDKGQPLTPNAERVVQLLARAPGNELESAAGTWWGVVNAITYFIDHEMGNDPDFRLNAAWFGQRARLKRLAFNLALGEARESFRKEAATTEE